MTDIKQTASGVWLVDLTGEALATKASTRAVFHYANGSWRCNCGGPDCAHIRAVKRGIQETMMPEPAGEKL